MRQGQDAWSEAEKAALTTILTECSTEQGKIDWQKFKERGAEIQSQLGRSLGAIKTYTYKMAKEGQLPGVSLRPPKSVGRRNKPAAPAENGATSHRHAPVSGPNFCPNCGFRMREVYAALGVQADLAKRNQ